MKQATRQFLFTMVNLSVCLPPFRVPLFFALNFPSAGNTGLHHRAQSRALLYLFETGSHEVAQTSLGVAVLLP